MPRLVNAWSLIALGGWAACTSTTPAPGPPVDTGDTGAAAADTASSDTDPPSTDTADTTTDTADTATDTADTASDVDSAPPGDTDLVAETGLPSDSDAPDSGAPPTDTGDTGDTGGRTVDAPCFDPPPGTPACVVTPADPTMTDALTVTASGLTDPDPTDGVDVFIRYEWWVMEEGIGIELRDPRSDDPSAVGSTAPPWGATRPSCADANVDGSNPNAPLNCYVGSQVWARCIAADDQGDGEIVAADMVMIGPLP